MIEKKDGKIYLSTPYNREFVAELKKSISDRKWDGKQWVCSSEAYDTVLSLLKKHYGYEPGQQEKMYKIKALADISEYVNSVSCGGVPIARAIGRDSGAKVCSGVTMLCGVINSGGSRNNWKTLVKEGAEFKVKTAARLESDEWWEVAAIEKDEAENIENLKIEKENLLKRLAEIDEIIKSKN